MKRLKLLLVLARMPSEAFGWLVVVLAETDPSRPKIWPDGLGGFRPESREAIKAVRKEAQHLMQNGGDDI